MEISITPLAYSIKGFCKAAGISVRFYYKLQETGDGPKETRVGRKVLIRHPTAQAWLAKMEAA
jgi:hypothetical protein